jgi:hypothetical protein
MHTSTGENDSKGGYGLQCLDRIHGWVRVRVRVRVAVNVQVAFSVLRNLQW